MAYRRLIEVFGDHDPDALPDEVIGVLSSDECAAFRDSGQAFTRLAEQCTYPALKALLAACAESSLHAMELVAFNDAPWEVYFRFTVGDSAPGLRLPVGGVPDSLPDALQRVYQSVGGIQDGDSQYGGSLWSPASICPLSDLGAWLEDDQPSAPEGCHLFLDTMGGDMYGYDSQGHALRYNHEVGEAELGGSLDELLNSYFTSFLETEE